MWLNDFWSAVTRPGVPTQDLFEDLFKTALLPVFGIIVFIDNVLGYPIPQVDDYTCLISIQVYMSGIYMVNLVHFCLFADLEWLSKLRTFLIFHPSRVEFGERRRINKWYFGFIFYLCYCFYDKHERKYTLVDGPVRIDYKCLNIGGCTTDGIKLPDVRSSTLLFSTRFIEEASKSGIVATEERILVPQIMESRLGVPPGEKWYYVSNVVVIQRTEGDDNFLTNGGCFGEKVSILLNTDRQRPNPTFQVCINEAYMTFKTAYNCAYMMQDRNKTKIMNLVDSKCGKGTTWNAFENPSNTFDESVAAFLKHFGKSNFKIQVNRDQKSFRTALELAHMSGLLSEEVDDSFMKIATSFVLNNYNSDISEKEVPVIRATQIPKYLSERGMRTAKIISVISFIMLCLDLLTRLYINIEKIERERRSLLS